MRKTASELATNVLHKLAYREEERSHLDEILVQRLKEEQLATKLAPWLMGGMGVGLLGGAGVGAALDKWNRAQGAMMGSTLGMLPGILAGLGLGHLVHGASAEHEARQAIREARKKGSGVQLQLSPGTLRQ